MKLSKLIQSLQEAQNLFNELDMDPDVVFDEGEEYSVIEHVKSEITHTSNEDDCNVVLKS